MRPSASCGPTDKTLDRDAADGVMNELDEYAVEEALRLKEAHGGEVTVLTMGPEQGRPRRSARRSPWAPTRPSTSSTTRCTAPTRWRRPTRWPRSLGTIGFDLVILGSESTDARTGVLAAMLAERLGVPQLTCANKVDVDGSHDHDRAAHRLRLRPGRGARCRPSCSASSRRSTSRATRPSRGSWRRRRSRSQTLTVADVGIDAGQVGPRRRASEVVDFAAAPPRAGGHDRQGRGRRRREDRRVPRVQEVHLRGRRQMAEVLVLVEHVDGEVKKVTLRAADPGPRGSASRRRSWSAPGYTPRRRTRSPSTARRRSTSPPTPS